MENVPYIKEFDQFGILMNPIKDVYRSPYSNRKARRGVLQKKPFHGNGKNTPLTVLKTSRYLRSTQIIISTGVITKGRRKIIEHYVSPIPKLTRGLAKRRESRRNIEIQENS